MGTCCLGHGVWSALRKRFPSTPRRPAAAAALPQRIRRARSLQAGLGSPHVSPDRRQGGKARENAGALSPDTTVTVDSRGQAPVTTTYSQTGGMRGFVEECLVVKVVTREPVSTLVSLL